MTTQLDASIGIKEETTYGTPVTVDRFVEFLSESLDVASSWSTGAGMRVGSRMSRADRRILTQTGAAGSIGMEAPTKGLGLWLKAVLGSVTTTLVETGVYQQVHTPLTTDPINSFTIQKGVPPIGGGSTHAMTMPGMVCKSLELSAKAGDPVEISTEWIGAEVRTNIAYAAPSYPSNLDILSFVHGAIVLGGTLTAPTTTALASSTASVAANVMDVKVKIESGIDDGGRALGGAGAITRKPVLGRVAVTGEMTIEYTDNVLRDASLAGTELAMVLTFTHPDLIGATAKPVLQIVVPVVVFESKIPAAGTGAAVSTSMSFSALDGTVASAPVYVVYRSLDTTP